jgi:drug/metabolite transporter (DMT)-like permease
MEKTTVIESPAPAASKPLEIRVLLAFFAIYVLWGTSFLAIRIAVLEVPPLFAAGTRFFVAGVVLYGFMRLRGRPRPSASQWRSLALIGLLMFVAEYGPLFWAEKYVPSGIASVLEATLPLITMALETWVFRRHRFHWPLLAAILLGFGGVSLLLVHNGEQSFGLLPCIAILAGATAWSLGSVLNRSLDLPESRPLTSGAAMLLGGGMLLVLSASFGELHPFPHVSLRAALALLYLIVCGSLLGFTAFVWLLARMPATRVASHAYVNPVVAVALGYFVAGEIVTTRTLIGTALVLFSVVLILRKEKVS